MKIFGNGIYGMVVQNFIHFRLSPQNIFGFVNL